MERVGKWLVISLKDKFQFKCHPGLPCFTQCCQQLEVMLTPYDILRLKRALEISSEEFLEKYTHTVFLEKIGLPMVALKKEETGCPFLKDTGCIVYNDRPSVCRLYPLGRAFSDKAQKEVYFLIKEPECLGFQENKTWTVATWLRAQKLETYDQENKGFSELIFLKATLRPWGLSLKERQMFFMTCYNLDAFRKFVFESSFLNRFDIRSKIVKKIKKDDLALLKFGFDWLKFALFRQPTLKVKA
ncbi:MAG: YkgJ family cysteine cluster protein [Candidatus Desulfofervidaceae bacterium]|nr:YkgJ family cysteine cluster protein [Candidatus Desulfofervidaceae bacterium]